MGEGLADRLSSVLSIDQPNVSLSRSSRMLLNGEFESIPTAAEPNSIEWVKKAYSKLLQLKEMILTEFLTFRIRAQEEIEPGALQQETIRSAERVIKFVLMTPADISRWPKAELYHTIKEAYIRASRNLKKDTDEQET